MASEVKIILTAVDQASAVLNKAGASMGTFNTGIKDSIKQFAGMAVAGGLAYKAVDSVVGVFKSSVNDTMDYAKAVRDVARYTGTSYEESSKLLQVADDLQIETQTLKVGFRNLAKEGIQPSISNLKQLAIEYQNLKTPVEKAQFAMEKFGARSGMEMAKMLELTSDQIDEIATSAENLGLVLDSQAIQATEDYRLSVDQLNDAWMGLKINMGTQIIPELTKLTTAINTNITENAMWDAIMKTNTYTADELWKVTKHGTDILTVYNDVVKNSASATEASKNAFIEASQAVQTLGDGLSVAEGAYGGLTTAADRLNAALDKYSKTLVFNKAAQFMDADAALELGIQLGVVDTRTMVLNESIPKLTERFDANKNGLIDAGAEASAYIAQLMGITDALESMPKEIDITVTINYKVQGAKGTGVPLPGGGFEYDFEQYGGPVNANQPYVVGEVGPELFVPNTPGRIIPNNRMGDYGGGMGGGITIHNHSAGAAALSWAMVRSHQKRRIQRSMGG